MNPIPSEYLFTRIGQLDVENQILRTELGKLQQAKTQCEKEAQGAKDAKKPAKNE